MNINQAKDMVASADIIGKVPLINGKHGIGKSEIVKQYAEEQGLHNETIMLSLADTGDIMGIPRTQEIGGQISTVWAAPVWINNIINRAFPAELEYESLVFKDEEFEKYVKANISTD